MSTRTRFAAPRTQIILAIAALLAVMATVVAARAATLPNLESQNLSAGTSVVTGCDTDGITVGWGDFTIEPGSDEYTFDEIKLTDVAPDCDGQTFIVTISKGDQTAINTTSGVLTLNSGTADIALTGPGSPVPVSEAAYVSALLTGAP